MGANTDINAVIKVTKQFHQQEQQKTLCLYNILTKTTHYREGPTNTTLTLDSVVTNSLLVYGME